MKSFKVYLLEADYMRFLKKNKNLNDQERTELNKYFSKKNPQAGSKIDWQSRKIRNWKYDDFENIRMQYTSGMKKSGNLKCNKIKIKGISKKDYINVRMPTKEFCAFIPLTYEAAQAMNTRKLGVCSGPWCIGDSTGNAYHWNEEVIEYKQVPVYVINSMGKWVVMIQEGNRKYDVWTVENNPRKTHEGIPGFSVRKNLLNPKQKAMYDEIREEYYDEEEETWIDIDDAEADYDQLVRDIETARNEWEAAYTNFWDEVYRIKENTKEKYENEWSEIQEEIEELEENINEYESLLDDEDANEESLFYLGGEEFTYSDIESFLEDAKDNKEDLEIKQGEIQEIIDSIDDIEGYEMHDAEGIEWTEDPPYEDYIYDDVMIPSIDSGRYDDYVDLMEEHGYGGDISKTNEEIYYYVIDDSGYSAQDVLSNNGWYHPEVLNE